jgi:alpha-tubulin suppressor-like RCC1 family protein
VLVAGGGTWLTLSAGSSFTCGIKSDRTLWCWGTNGSRQLGDGTTTERAAPVQEKSLATNWASVDAGNAFTCATKLDGSRHCWGTNGFAQLGDGTLTSALEPKQVDTEASWASVRAGDTAACGLRVDGALWCWGDGGVGITAQPGSESLDVEPQQVGASSDWQAVVMGQRFACGLRMGGALQCWGSASRAATGFGFDGDRWEPALVGNDADWTAVDIHTDAGCGLRGTELHCWGKNTFGNLGDGSDTSRAAPTPASMGAGFSQVSVGRYYGCGVANGELLCWGRDDGGQLGNGTTLANQAVPKAVVATANTSPWVEVATGTSSTCARKQDGSLWCWGSDGSGQLGNGAAVTATQQAPYQAGLPGALDWARVSGSADTFCGLRSGGAVHCWGLNSEGQVGNDTQTNAPAPVQVAAGPFATISAGRHVCGITTTGELWCWGRNSEGQIGVGNTVSPVKVPTRVGLATDWASVFVGPGTFTCATKTDGSLWCWGNAFFGQTGLGNLTTTSSPQKVPVQGTWSSASGGTDYACAVRGDGRLACWGGSYGGQLGLPTSYTSTPTRVFDPLPN